MIHLANDIFYREMTDNQLQAAFKELEKNLEFDCSDSMKREMKLILNIAEERGIKLGNRFDAIRGYIEFGPIND